MEIDVGRKRIKELAAQFTAPKDLVLNWDELLDQVETLTDADAGGGLTIFDLMGPINGHWTTRLKDFAVESALPDAMKGRSGGLMSFLISDTPPTGPGDPDVTDPASPFEELEMLGQLLGGVSDIAMIDVYVSSCIDAIAAESESYRSVLAEEEKQTEKRNEEYVEAEAEEEEAEVVGAKEYSIFVCPPIESPHAEIHPLYDCKNDDAFLQPGKCPDCGKELAQINASDTDYYLSTYEHWA